MNEQIILNIIFGIASFAAVWILNGIKDSLKALHEADTALTSKVQAIELLVAGKYVLKDDFKNELSKVTDVLFHKLDKIEAKLDTKLDRVNGNVYYERQGDKP